jgi:hypothetical protein
MPNLTFDFTWYKDSKGYRLDEAMSPVRKRGQSEAEAVLEMPAKDIRPARIVRNGGSLQPYQPLNPKIGNLFEPFSKIETEGAVLKFVKVFGPLTLSGLRGKGDVVEELIGEAKDMRSGVRKHLGKLNVTIDTISDETQLRVRPVCLLDAIWLQYAQANARSRQCPQCDEWFLVGPGTDRRADAKYCGEKCRVKCLSLKRSRR